MLIHFMWSVLLTTASHMHVKLNKRHLRKNWKDTEFEEIERNKQLQQQQQNNDEEISSNEKGRRKHMCNHSKSVFSRLQIFITKGLRHDMTVKPKIYIGSDFIISLFIPHSRMVYFLLRCWIWVLSSKKIIVRINTIRCPQYLSLHMTMLRWYSTK